MTKIAVLKRALIEQKKRTALYAGEIVKRILTKPETGNAVVENLEGNRLFKPFLVFMTKAL